MRFYSFIIIFMKKLELLAPVGNFERLQAAIYFGADAVYFGGTRFGLRAFANKFDEELFIPHGNSYTSNSNQLIDNIDTDKNSNGSKKSENQDKALEDKANNDTKV